MHRQLSIVLLALAPAAGTSSEPPAPNELRAALAATPDPASGERIYRSDCRACHQSNGYGVADGSIPALAGQHASVLIKQLVDMREDERHNPRMEPFIGADKLDSAQALADVAAYLAALEAAPQPMSGSGADLLRGEELYQSLCAHCHGSGALGDEELRFPRLQGQHYAYLVRQLEDFASGDRHNIDMATRELFISLSPAEMRAVADFISRMSPDGPLPRRLPDGDLLED